MEQQNNTYKYLSIVLAIIAIIFAVLYFTKPSQPISETLGEISADAQECRDKVATWNRDHGAQATTTEEQRNELSNILEECEDSFENSQDKI